VAAALQITTPSVRHPPPLGLLYRLDALTATQPTASKHLWHANQRSHLVVDDFRKPKESTCGIGGVMFAAWWMSEVSGLSGASGSTALRT